MGYSFDLSSTLDQPILTKPTFAERSTDDCVLLCSSIILEGMSNMVVWLSAELLLFQ